MPKTAQKDASVATVKKQGAVMKHIKKYWQWYAMMFIPIVGPVKIYAQNYLQARLSEVNRQ